MNELLNRVSRLPLRRFFFGTAVLSLSASTTLADVGGTVFRDYNQNGVQDAGELGFGATGLTATAYGSGNTILGTSPVAANGTYNIAGVTSASRLEFTIPAYLNAGAPSTGSGSLVQFLSGATSSANLAIQNPAEVTDENPRIITSCYESGSGATGASNAGNGAFISFDYNAFGRTGDTLQYDATISEVGATWGIGYQINEQRVFLGAVLKRHSGLANGLGDIYHFDYSDPAAPSFNGHFSIQGVIPDNGGAAIDVGTVTRTTVPGAIDTGAAGDNQLSDDPGQPTRDLDAFSKVGAVGLGDLDLDESGNTLWMLNLNTSQQSIIAIDVSAGVTIPTDGSAIAGSNVNRYLLSSISGLPTSAAGVFRPWALAFHDGRGYLGGVTDSSNNPANNTDLTAYTLSFDPANPAAGFTTEFTLDLTYNRESASIFAGFSAPALWGAWINDNADITYSGTGVGNGNHVLNHSPILSDIEFAEDGDMILGFTDRSGSQFSRAQYHPESARLDFAQIHSAGDIVHVCRVAGAWVIEGAAGCPVNDTETGTYDVNIPNLRLGDDGPSNAGEFYFNDQRYAGANPNDGHAELAMGALALRAGSGEVLSTSVDPLAFRTGGTRRHLTSTGGVPANNAFEIYNSNLNPGTLSKSNGLGDIELVGSAPDIIIGNRVWCDDNNNGIQDPEEAGLGGISVTLTGSGLNGILGDGDDVSVVTTTASIDDAATPWSEIGSYYFTNATGGNASFLTFDSNYSISVDTTQAEFAGKIISTGSSAINDEHDNDASASGVVLFSTAGPGANNFSFDIGVVDPPCEITITNAGASNISINAATGVITYDVDVTVTYANPPAGSITVSAGGQMASIAAGATTTTITGISMDEDGPFTISAAFSNDTSCNDSATYEAPAASACGTDNVGGTVFLDTNNNGSDDSETGTPFVPVRAYDEANALVGFGVTDSSGDFTLTLLDGSTLLDMTSFDDGVRIEFGVDQDAPVRPGAAGGTLIQVLPDPQGNCDVDLAISVISATTKEIGNLVFIDKDFDGVQDGCDTPLANVDVALYNTAGVLISSAQTDSNGHYLFSSDPAGIDTDSAKYNLSALQQNAAGGADKEFCVVIGNQGATPQFVDGILTVDGVRFEIATANVTNTGIGSISEEADSDALQGDVAGLSGVLHACTTIPAGDTGCNNHNTDIGVVYQLPRVGNLVYIDTNGDGDFDAGIDTPVGGIKTQLFPVGVDPIANPTSFVDESVTSLDTGEVGCYELRAPEGSATLGQTDYFVFIPPSEFVGTLLANTLSVPGNGGDDQSDDNIGENGIDSAAPAVTGIRSSTINLVPGGEPTNEPGATCSTFTDDNNLDSTVDFGFTTATGGIGNLVFNDVNNDGIFQPGTESGIDGVTVILTKDGGTFVSSTVTTGGGCYLFSGIPADNDYVITVVAENFGGGEPLLGLVSSLGSNAAGDDTVGENGVDAADPADDGVSSNPFAFTPGSAPTAATNPAEDGKLSSSDDANDANFDLTIDFGFAPPATYGLGNLVFMDVNGDTNFDPSVDMGVDGVTVEVYREAGSDDVLVGTDTTADGGFWKVDGLPAGTYYAVVTSGNFTLGTGPLSGKLSAPGVGGDNGTDDTAVDGDENGIDDLDALSNGIRSGDIVLGPLEPTSESGATDAVAPSSEPDNRFDATIDFGFIVPVGVGNLVFCDDNGDGNYDPGAGETGVDGVSVEIYRTGDTPGTDSPAGVTTTANGGFWEVNGLFPGTYFAYIPGEEFTTGGQLIGKGSSIGNGTDAVSDDNTDENGLDTPDGDGGISSSEFTLTIGGSAGESGATGPAGTNTPDGNVNTTIDFAFTPNKATNFAAFIIENGLTGANAAPDADPDMDGRSNLEEFALCLKPGSGLNGAAVDGGDSDYPGFCIESDGTEINGTFLRPIASTGLTYTLEHAGTLATPTAWDPIVISGSNSTTADQGDGTELVTITDVELLTALDSGSGFVRLSITLDSPTETVTTKPQGWLTHDVTPNCETFAYPFEDKPLYTGSGTLSGTTLTLNPATLTTGDDFGAALTASGARYYIEVIGGENIGHRVEIIGGTANTIELIVDGDPCGGSADGTLASLPANLDGDMIVVRRYRTIDELFPPANFTAGADSDTGANLLIFDATAQSFTTYFLLDDGSNPIEWVQVGDDITTSDRGSEIVPPGRGIFTHNKAPAVAFELLEIGTVRCNPSIQPLKAGYNFVAATHPVATSPEDRGMVSSTFNGTTDPDTADQLLFWKGDAVPGNTGYDARFYLVHDDGTNPALEQWTDTDDVDLLDRNTLDDFPADRSAIYDTEDPNLTYSVPVPFTTN